MTEFVVIVKDWLSSNFKMKDMDKATYILGVKIHKDYSKVLLALSQESYIKKILERFHIQNCKPIDTSIATRENLSMRMCPKTLEEIRQIERVFYSSVIGSLMYAII